MPRALLIVDKLKDFGPGGSLAVAGSEKCVPLINALQVEGGYDVIVLIQDWHPANHRSFASNNPGVATLSLFRLGGKPQVAWPDHCVQGTDGADFVDGLITHLAAIVIRKGMNPDVDSYSGFYDNDGTGTGLTGFLRDRGITAIDVVGDATDYCDKFTALDGVQDGFDVRLVADCCAAVNVTPGDGDKAIAEMQEAGVAIVTSEQVLA
jgi:nicotinamidase/pyrazinamidase